VAAVEIRIAHTLLPARMDEVRQWLSGRESAHRLTSTGSSDERVVVVEFSSDADAAEFAEHFGGRVIGG
jgi:hypothetical protein